MTFDDPRNHTGTHATKWDSMQAFSGVSPDDGIPMWVADMSFDAAPCILDALRAEVSRGYMGYFGDPAPVSAAVCNWFGTQHGWPVEPGWISYTHGVIAGIAQTLDTFSEPGNSVIVFSPVYHAFYRQIRAMGRNVLESQLHLRDGRYEMNLDALSGQMTGREKILILCSPHNPGGRQWSRDELRALATFCAEHDLILLSDEIHMDLTFPGSPHVPTAIAAPDALDRLVVVSSASKGFNTAGAETGFMIVPDAALRERLAPSRTALGGTPNRFGMIMLKAAFTSGAAWSRDVRAYIAENFSLWQDRIGKLPGIKVMPMTSTYLSWVDFSGTGMSPAEAANRLAQDARIATSPGAHFGTGGEAFHRFNLALPRPELLEAITRIETAFADLQ